MKDQLNEKLAQILDGLMVATKATADFAGAQLPDIAETYIKYGLAKSIVGVLVCALLVTLGVWAFYKASCDPKDRHGEPRPSVVFTWVISTIVIFFSSIVLFFNIHELLLVSLAPKVWLLQEVAGLIRSFK